MMHVAAYSNSALGTTANTDTNAVSDSSILPITNNHFLPQQNLNLLWAWAGSPTALRARLTSGTIRQIAPRYIRPINVGVLPAANPNVDWLGNRPFQVRGLEELALEFTAAPGTTERAYGVICLSDSIIPAPVGNVQMLRATSTTAAVLATWTAITLTFETQLPQGVYSVIGGECFSTNGIAFRLTFDNQFYRPGFLMEASVGQRNPWWEYQAQLGEWGRFRTTNLPRCEVLCNSTDAAFELYLQVVRIGDIS